jgi:hypothetical protein
VGKRQGAKAKTNLAGIHSQPSLKLGNVPDAVVVQLITAAHKAVQGASRMLLQYILPEAGHPPLGSVRSGRQAIAGVEAPPPRLPLPRHVKLAPIPGGPPPNFRIRSHMSDTPPPLPPISYA